MNKSFPYLKFSFFLIGYAVVSFALYEIVGDTYKFWTSGIEKQAKVIQLDHINVHMRGLKTYYYLLDIEGKRSVHKFNFELIEKRYYNVLSINDGEKIILGNKNSSLLDVYSSLFGTLPAYMSIAVLFYLLYGALKSHLTRPRNPYD
ncbi:hypothetical protein AB6C73_06420 [Vibrio splendidus]